MRFRLSLHQTASIIGKYCLAMLERTRYKPAIAINGGFAMLHLIPEYDTGATVADRLAGAPLADLFAEWRAVHASWAGNGSNVLFYAFGEVSNDLERRMVTAGVHSPADALAVIDWHRANYPGGYIRASSRECCYGTSHAQEHAHHAGDRAEERSRSIFAVLLLAGVLPSLVVSHIPLLLTGWST
jgi:hypothetical protein